jgi:hypothetical protein
VFIGFVIGLFTGGLLAAFFILGPLPFCDRGFRIFACPTAKARDAIVEVLAGFGLKPRFRIDSSKVKRAALNDNATVINWTEPALWEQMGRPAAGIAVVSRNPERSAKAAIETLKSRGFASQYLGELDESVPQGAMVFVRTEALAGSVLVFRKHLLKMGPRPQRWR